MDTFNNIVKEETYIIKHDMIEMECVNLPLFTLFALTFPFLMQVGAPPTSCGGCYGDICLGEVSGSPCGHSAVLSSASSSSGPSCATVWCGAVL